MATRSCLSCGQPFDVQHHRQRYCPEHDGHPATTHTGGTHATVVYATDQDAPDPPAAA